MTGLTEGDEISVIFQDEGGTEVHSLVYLPAAFPRLTSRRRLDGQQRRARCCST